MTETLLGVSPPSSKDPAHPPSAGELPAAKELVRRARDSWSPRWWPRGPGRVRPATTSRKRVRGNPPRVKSRRHRQPDQATRRPRRNGSADIFARDLKCGLNSARLIRLSTRVLAESSMSRRSPAGGLDLSDTKCSGDVQGHWRISGVQTGRSRAELVTG